MLSEDQKEALATRLRQIKFAKEIYLLNQFRRHPDWHAAFKRVLGSRLFHVEYVINDKSVWCIPDESLPAIQDAVDQEFIDEIIRNEAKEKAA